MKKKLLLLLPFLALSLTGCPNFVQVDDIAIKKKEVNFVNYDPGYDIESNKAYLYFLKNDDVPYCNPVEFINEFDGFFDSSKVRFSLRELGNNLLLTSDYYLQAMFDWKNNKIQTNSLSLFNYIIKDQSTINYSAYLKEGDYYSSGSNVITFDLGKYGFDIYHIDGKVYVPLCIMNMLFCSPNYYNIVYNGTKLCGYYGEIDQSDNFYDDIYKCNLNGKTQSSDLRNAAYNSMLFALDYFYGLKEFKGITSFADYTAPYSSKFLKGSARTNLEAYKYLFFNQLDELHTRMDSPSFYDNDPSSFTYYLSDCGQFWDDYYTTRSIQSAAKQASINSQYLNDVRYCDNVAIIDFNSFVTGNNSDIYDSQGNVEEDAYKHDSFYFFHHCLEDIEKHPEVTDILVDLSLNGGGNIGAEFRVLGFLTDVAFKDYSFDTLSREEIYVSYKVDTDRDGDYDDLDSYSNYNWNILQGINTFSAANNFLCKVKQYNLAKTFGQRSGGGMCSVLPLVFADGTAVTISSNNTLRYYSASGDEHYIETESGFAPDVQIPYEDFYNDEKLVQYINEGK